MRDTLIQLETAKLASEKGFHLGIGYGGTDDFMYYYQGQLTTNFRGDNPIACSQSLLAKWLREEHDLVIVVRKSNDKWHWYIQGALQEGYGLETYEQALENGLREALKLIK